MTADFTPPPVNGAEPAIRCVRCGCLKNSRYPDADCVLGCDDDGVRYEPTFVRGIRDVALPEPVEDCDHCGEPVNPDAYCPHARQLCAEHLDRCRDCRYESERWGA